MLLQQPVFFSEAIHDYDSTANIHVDKDSRIEFFKVGRRLYSTLAIMWMMKAIWRHIMKTVMLRVMIVLWL